VSLPFPVRGTKALPKFRRPVGPSTGIFVSQHRQLSLPESAIGIPLRYSLVHSQPPYIPHVLPFFLERSVFNKVTFNHILSPLKSLDDPLFFSTLTEIPLTRSFLPLLAVPFLHPVLSPSRTCSAWLYNLFCSLERIAQPSPGQHRPLTLETCFF